MDRINIGLDIIFDHCYKSFYALNSEVTACTSSSEQLHITCCKVVRNTNVRVCCQLTHFQPMSHFYTPWKDQKTGGFLIFSGGIEVEHWLKIG